MSVIAKLYFDGGERTLLFGEEEKKAFGTSSDDADSAKEIKIYIYALDSWNFSKRTSKVSIHRVSPTNQKKKVGTTKGDGTAKT